MKILITGASGFIGGYLVEHLAGKGHEVHAMRRRSGDHSDLPGHWVEADIQDTEAIHALVADILPDRVYHLAAQSLPMVSWAEPVRTFEINMLGTVNLLEGLRAAGIAPLTIIAGSSAAYAPGTDEAPIDENARLDPFSIYGVSKLSQEQSGLLYGKHYDMPVIVARPFFLVGPRKTGDVTSDFARRIVAIENGAEPRMRVGDLTVVRDLLDIRDGIEAFALLAERGTPGEAYNICSGHGYAVSRILEMLKRFSTAEVEVYQDPELLRPIDEQVKIGNPAKLQVLGWQATRDIKSTMKDTLEYWRNQEVVMGEKT